jgi:molybdate transport system regulatory protein
MDDRHIALEGTVWMTVGGEQLGGTNRIGLLAALAQCGSITAAAKQVGLSYKAAWEAIDTMNRRQGRRRHAVDGARRATGRELHHGRATAP